MRCLRVDEIYLYLEKELSPSENKRVKEHLTFCPRCKNAVEERRILLQASESLPFWEAPPDFARQVIAQIFPKKVTLRQWLIAASAGLSSTTLTFLAFFALSGENLLEVLIGLGHRLLELLQTFSVFFIKAFKLAFLLIRIIIQFLGFFAEGFVRLSSILSPEAQIILIILTVIFSVTLFLGVRRKFMAGEKT